MNAGYLLALEDGYWHWRVGTGIQRGVLALKNQYCQWNVGIAI